MEGISMEKIQTKRLHGCQWITDREELSPPPQTKRNTKILSCECFEVGLGIVSAIDELSYLDQQAEKYQSLKQFIAQPVSYYDNATRSLDRLFIGIEKETFETQITLLNALIKSLQEDSKNNPNQYGILYANPRDIESATDRGFPGVKDKTYLDRFIWLIKKQLDTIEAEKELIEEMEQHLCFKSFDGCNVWKLAVDHKDHEKAKYGYESQPGYLKGYFKGLKLVLSHVRMKTLIPNWDMFLSINQEATTGVEDQFCLPIEQFSERSTDFSYYAVTQLTKASAKEVRSVPITQVRINDRDFDVNCDARVFSHYTLVETS